MSSNRKKFDPALEAAVKAVEGQIPAPTPEDQRLLHLRQLKQLAFDAMKKAETAEYHARIARVAADKVFNEICQRFEITEREAAVSELLKTENIPNQNVNPLFRQLLAPINRTVDADEDESWEGA